MKKKYQEVYDRLIAEKSELLRLFFRPHSTQEEISAVCGFRNGVLLEYKTKVPEYIQKRQGVDIERLESLATVSPII